MLCERARRARIAIDTAAPVLRQVERGLARRSCRRRPPPPAEPAQRRSLEVGGRVVHAGALEPLEVVDVEAPVPGTRGDDHRTRRDLAAVGEHHHVEALLELEPARPRTAS